MERVPADVRSPDAPTNSPEDPLKLTTGSPSVTPSGSPAHIYQASGQNTTRASSLHASRQKLWVLPPKGKAISLDRLFLVFLTIFVLISPGLRLSALIEALKFLRASGFSNSSLLESSNALLIVLPSLAASPPLRLPSFILTSILLSFREGIIFEAQPVNLYIITAILQASSLPKRAQTSRLSEEIPLQLSTQSMDAAP